MSSIIITHNYSKHPIHLYKADPITCDKNYISYFASKIITIISLTYQNVKNQILTKKISVVLIKKSVNQKKTHNNKASYHSRKLYIKR